MSSVSNVTFPDGIKHEHAERGKPRVVPPVRFVPTEVTDKTNPRSTTIDITEDQKEKHFLYRHNDVEGFLCFQRTFDGLMRKKDYMKTWNRAKTFVDANKNRNTEEAKEAVLESKGTMKACVDSAFQLYSSLLDSNLASEWEEIVNEICHKPPGTKTKKGIPTQQRARIGKP